MKKIKHFIVNRKILTTIIVLIIIGGGYYTYTKLTSTSSQNSYVLSNPKIGNVVTTVSGTGQIYASSQLDIKSKASGDIVYLNKEINGKQIKKGELIAQIDTRDALISLESSRISYAKAIEPADEATLLQANNSLNDAIINNSKSYSDGFASVVNTFIDLPIVMSGLNNIFYTRNGYLQTENVRAIGQTALDIQSKAGISFDLASAHYNNLISQYKKTSSLSSTSTIESLIDSTYSLAKEISNVIKNTQNAVDYIKDQKEDSAGNTAQTDVASWTSTMNSNVSSLLSSKNTITNTLQSINQQKLNLAKIVQGTTELDLASQKLQLQQAENNYANYFIRAPFDGLLARLSVKATDSVSNGTVIGTLVSEQKASSITLNEVDVAKVKVGQKVKLTFDAIEGLILDGTVTVVDSIGTVTQGVVNYNVEIMLDSNDERIKSGMSVSASIIVDSKDNVLTVPNSAIKTQGKLSFVEVFNPPLTITRGTTGTPSAVSPRQKMIEIGVSNDLLTEVISGITDTDQIVIRTITGTAAANKTNTSIFGGSNAMRIPAGGSSSSSRMPRGN